MKLNKLLILATAAVLSSCSLGANSLSKEQFKKILEDEVRQTILTSAHDAPHNLSLDEFSRNISAKTLVETNYGVQTSDIGNFLNPTDQEGEYSITCSRVVSNYINKQIVNANGIKTFADIEKTINEKKYVLQSGYNEGEHEASIKIVEKTINTNIDSDYLSVNLDLNTGRIDTAEIVINDDIYSFGKEEVKYDTFVKDGDEEEPVDPEEGEEVKISLADTIWTLTDSTKAVKKAVIQISSDVDNVVSKNKPVGIIMYDTEIRPMPTHVPESSQEEYKEFDPNKDPRGHKLYMFERSDGSYYFEIRETTITEIDNTLEKEVYDKNDPSALDLFAPKLESFITNADVAAIEDRIIGSYSDLYDFMLATIASEAKVEILEKATAGIMFRMVDGELYKEVSISKLPEKERVRKIEGYTQRGGLNGNEIYWLSFGGF